MDGLLTDEDLLAAVSGDGRSAEKIYRSLSPAVMGYLQARGVEDTEAVAQEEAVHGPPERGEAEQPEAQRSSDSMRAVARCWDLDGEQSHFMTMAEAGEAGRAVDHVIDRALVDLVVDEAAADDGSNVAGISHAMMAEHYALPGQLVAGTSVLEGSDPLVGEPSFPAVLPPAVRPHPEGEPVTGPMRRREPGVAVLGDECRELGVPAGEVLFSWVPGEAATSCSRRCAA